MINSAIDSQEDEEEKEALVVLVVVDRNSGSGFSGLESRTLEIFGRCQCVCVWAWYAKENLR